MEPSSPFDLGPNGNKIAFLFNGGGDTGGEQFLILLPDGRLHVLPEYPRDFRWRRPNVNATEVTLGAWHRIEWYCQLSTGTLKWWLDGVLQGSHTDVRKQVQFQYVSVQPDVGRQQRREEAPDGSLLVRSRPGERALILPGLSPELSGGGRPRSGRRPRPIAAPIPNRLAGQPRCRRHQGVTAIADRDRLRRLDLTRPCLRPSSML